MRPVQSPLNDCAGFGLDSGPGSGVTALPATGLSDWDSTAQSFQRPNYYHSMPLLTADDQRPNLTTLLEI